MESKKSTAKPAETTKEKYFYGRGGRKTAIARVRFYPKGKGEIIINDKDYKEYFPTKELQDTVLKALILTGLEKTSQVTVKVVGSGKIAQSQAVRHGISRALEAFDAELRPVLKAEGFLTRDPRVKERKKPGLRRARRAPQWSKR
jgi:small subunit ribosomal protein S9